MSTVALLQNFSELNCHIFHSCTYSNLVQSPFHPVSLNGGIWSEILHEIWLSASEDFWGFFNTLCFSFYFVSFLLQGVTKYLVADVLYYCIQKIKNDHVCTAADNVISKGKIDYFLSPEPKEKFQPSLSHVFKIACLINVMEGKSVLSTS